MQFIDRRSPIPLYHQLKKHLVESIENGDYRIGDAIPPEMYFVSQFSLSRATVRRAMQEMEKDGYINRAAGRGTFVIRNNVSRGLNRLTSFTEDMHERGHSVTSRILKYENITPPPRVSDMLSSKSNEPLLYVYRLRYADQSPIAINLSYLKLPDNVTISEEELKNTQSLWTLLENKGIPLIEADKTIEALPANKEHADLLNLPIGASLLVVEGVAYTFNHIPVEYHQVISSGDRYKYSLHLVR
jgi:GntR family transcriptional regulator